MRIHSILAVAFSLFFAIATVASAHQAQITQGKLTSLGKTSLQSPMTGTTPTPATHSGPMQIIDEPKLMKLMYKTNANAAMPSLKPPTSSKNASIGIGGSTFTVPGLDNGDSRAVNGGMVGDDLEPPDQGLCAGAGQIFEVINLVFAVYDENGNKIGPDVSANAFFGVGANFLVGDFISDPRCYYDQSTQHWFITVTDIEDIGFIANGRSFVLLAVSEGPNLLGNFNLYAIDTTDDGLDGTPADPGCLPVAFEGCFGDQPLLGADDYGFYVSTNEFGLVTPFFNGAQIYAISKADLESVSFPIGFVHFGNLTIGGGLAASVHPAQSPAANPSEANSGTEFFLNTLNFNGTSDNRIGVWSLTNTSTLNSTPNLFLQNLVLTVKPYSEPGAAQQKSGSFPQGTALGDPEEALNPDDNRMQQVYLSGGQLFSAITSTINDGTEFVDGVEWFIVSPSFSKSGVLEGGLSGNDYLTVKGQNLIYPAVAVDADHDGGAMTFTLVGPDFFPSAAFINFNSKGPNGNVNVLAQGSAPDDGFSGYFGVPSNEQLAGRWGDYSAAVADGENIFIATEYISGGPRDIFVNWATSMSEIKTTAK